MDDAISPLRRVALRALRAELISELDLAALASPRDGFITGQQIRFTLDQSGIDSLRIFARAISLANRCRGDRWWCLALQGYAQFRTGHLLQADSAFVLTMQQVPDSLKCGWNDVSVLFDGANVRATDTIHAEKKYKALSCSAREAVNERFWWMSSPMWSSEGNERRVEHFARKVALILHSSLTRDETINWRPQDGGDAASQMILRYGWPTYMYMTSPKEDNDNKLGFQLRFRRGPEGPYTTFEYSFGRPHVVPNWNAIEHPLAAVRTDWTLGSDRAWPGVDDVYKIPRWWPTEHMRRTRPIFEMADPQMAWLRREDRILLGTATDLKSVSIPIQSGFQLTTNDSLSTALVASTAPTDFRVKRSDVRVKNGRLAMRTAITDAPALLSLEATVNNAAPFDLRTRFAVTPPRLLSANSNSSKSISDPILLDEQSVVGSELTMNPDSAMALMAATSIIRRGGKISLYWETYGFSPSDSVATVVHIERTTNPNPIKRLALMLNIGNDVNTPVKISWKGLATENGRVVEMNSRVPIIAHAITLDAATLPTGDYWLSVSTATKSSLAIGKTRIRIR
ncbi:MAG: hypothetical protein ABJB66_10370 [Gemmatimonadaceae bacterium]